MLKSKDDVLSLLATIDSTEDQIAIISMMRDKESVIEALETLGLEIIPPNFIVSSAVAEEHLIHIAGNFDISHVHYYLSQHPLFIARCIITALSGFDSYPLYLNIEAKINARIKMMKDATEWLETQ